jgi:predicted permease
MVRDCRIALRSLRGWRWGAFVAVLTLSIGIATTTALYALLRVALADSAVDIESVHRVVRIYGFNPTLGHSRSPLGWLDFEALRSTVRSFESVAAYDHSEMTVGSAADDVVTVMRVSPHFFDVMRGRAIEGRLITAADAAADVPAAVVGELTWRRRFAGRRIAEAPSIRLDGREHTVVGVLPASFSFSFIGITADVWTPLPAAHDRSVSVIARLASDVAWATAAAELDRLAPPHQPESGWRWRGIPLQQDMNARTGGATAWIFLPAVVVLVIACVNVACMLLARGMKRETELSVRMALGASRGGIFRQCLLENGLIGLAAGVLGTALAFAAIGFVVRTVVDVRPELGARLSGDFGLLPIAVTVSLLACLLFGLVPAMRLSRCDVASALRGSAPPPRVKVVGYGVRDLVVFVELALASVLIVMTALSFTIFGVIQEMRPGFEVAELLDVRVPAREAAAAAERVRAIAGVTHVALASSGPGGGTSGLASTPGRGSMAVSIVEAGQGFFETTGLAIVRGRSFLPDETAGAAVAVVSEATASALWPREDPLGRPLDMMVRGRAKRLLVIGVAEDAMRVALPRVRPGEVYRPLDSGAQTEVAVILRSPRPKQVARDVSAAARTATAVAPARIRIYADTTRERSSGLTFLRLFGAFALVALLLAGSGIFAVVSQSVAQRTPEFGVRLALGATPWRVLRTVLGREMKLIAAALATGTIGTVAMTRSSGFDDAAMIVAVNMSRPEWGLGLVGLCGAVATAACLVATWRIVTLDPSEVLRRM